MHPAESNQSGEGPRTPPPSRAQKQGQAFNGNPPSSPTPPLTPTPSPLPAGPNNDGGAHAAVLSPHAVEGALFFEDCYELCQGGALGTGQGSPVRRCRNMASGKVYACKQIKDSVAARQELRLQRACQVHPLVASVVDVFVQQRPPSPPPRGARSRGEGDWLVLVVELAEGKDLFDHLKKPASGHMRECEVAGVARQLAEVLAHMHSKGCMHGDIKPENVLFRNATSPDILVCDFGHACDKTDRQRPKFTASYVAPEMVLSMQSRRSSPSGQYLPFSHAADLWSLGVTLYVCLSGFLPFYSKQPRRPSELPSDMRDMILRADETLTFPVEEWSHCTAEAQMVVRRLLDTDPNTRMTAEQLLQHPWCTN